MPLLCLGRPGAGISPICPAEDWRRRGRSAATVQPIAATSHPNLRLLELRRDGTLTLGGYGTKPPISIGKFKVHPGPLMRPNHGDDEASALLARLDERWLGLATAENDEKQNCRCCPRSWAALWKVRLQP